MAVHKEYNLRRHYDTQHAKAHQSLSDSEKKALAVKMSEGLLKEQQVLQLEHVSVKGQQELGL